MMKSIKNKIDAHLRRRVREEVDLERVVINHLAEDIQKLMIDFTNEVQSLLMRIEQLEVQVSQLRSELEQGTQ